MNPLNINHIKVEKANAIKLRYQKLRKITNFFRVFEIFLVIAVISRLTFQLPLALAFNLSNEYFHRLSLILVSPRFVFVLGNAIVIILFVNSSQSTTTQNNPNTRKRTHQNEPKKKEVKSQSKKQGKTEESVIVENMFSTPEHHLVKVYHRSKSEKPRREKMEENRCELRRSNTEIMRLKRGCNRVGCCKETGDKGHYPEDHMSSEEFRRTIEDFIAKQQEYLRQEEDFSEFETNFEL